MVHLMAQNARITILAQRLPSVYVAHMPTRPASNAASGHAVGIKKRPIARLRDRLDSKRSSRLLAALAEPQRLRIVQCLEKGPCSVGEICRALRSPLANTSHHLQYLRHVGLVRVQRRGRNMLYSLAPGLFRPPEGDAPPAFDFGVCRLELGGVVDKVTGANVAAERPARSESRSRQKASATVDLPAVEGTWIGQWRPSNAGNASVARGKGRPEIRCVVEARGPGVWHATFEGESGHAYKYAVEMEGRLEGGAVLFKGSTNLGEQNGGVFDWVGRATDKQFAGFYSSSHYTGVFNLKRAKKN
jgi:DNA-binding transcriptional ArsR family regulator